MICPVTNSPCFCSNHCRRQQLPEDDSFTQTKVERVVIPCILIATKLLATEEEQKRLEAAMLRMSDNFITKLLKLLENEVH